MSFQNVVKQKVAKHLNLPVNTLNFSQLEVELELERLGPHSEDAHVIIVCVGNVVEQKLNDTVEHKVFFEFDLPLVEREVNELLTAAVRAAD